MAAVGDLWLLPEAVTDTRQVAAEAQCRSPISSHLEARGDRLKSFEVTHWVDRLVPKPSR